MKEIKPNFDPGVAGVMMAQAKQKFVGDVLKKKAFLTPDRIALEWEEKIWTFKDLNEEVNKLANSFQSIGIRRGDRISVLCKNRAECSHILYAAAKIGAIVAFLNWRYTEKELEEAINVVTPETIIVSEEYFEKIQSVLPNIEYIKRQILLDDIETSKDNIYAFENLLNDGANVEPSVEMHEEDALFIVYTSGTTGTPKGATISHRSEMQRIFAQMATFPSLLGVTEDDISLARDPFFHVSVIDQMFATHAMGGKVLIISGNDPVKIVDILEKEKIGWIPLSPGMYEGLIQEIKRRNAKIKGIRAIGSMADIVADETKLEITRLVNAPFFNTYGLTEIGMHNFSQNILPIGSEGIEYKSMAKAEGIFCEVRLLDSEGNEVPDGEPGELVIRTPMMFSGYWNNPKENEKVFRNGWFHTGDVLRRTHDGTLDFVSRTKYMIKSGGENIYPAEIERVLLSHSQIQEAVVVGASHPKWGETPVAFVAITSDISSEELREYCKHNLAGYKVPSIIECVKMEDFPRNSNGKILRDQVEGWIEKVQEKIQA